MISKITKGKGFAGTLKYGQEKDGAQVIDHNLSTDQPSTQAAEMQAVAAQNPRCQKPVFHASLSAAPGEQLTDDQWRVVGRDYMKGMGFDDSQYVITRHTDRDHDHIHIAANRVRQSDFGVVSEKYDHKKNQDVCRQIERDHGLKQIQSGPGQQPHQPGTGGLADSMRKRIDESAKEAQGDQQKFFSGLEKRGIGVKLNESKTTGRISGISYTDKAGGKTFKGSELGKNYSWSGIQNKLGKAKSGVLEAGGKDGGGAATAGQITGALSKVTGGQAPKTPEQAVKAVITTIAKQTAAAMQRGMRVGRQHQAE